MYYNDESDSESEDDGYFDKDDDTDDTDDDDDDEEEEDNEGFDFGDDSDDDEVQKPTKKARKADANPSSRSLVVKDSREEAARADRWFSHPIFNETVMPDFVAAQEDALSSSSSKTGKKDDIDDIDGEVAITGEYMIGMMPKTDKEIRSAKRSKVNARKERRDAKKKNGEPLDDDALFDKKEMQVVANTHEDYSSRKIKTSGAEGEDVDLDRETIKKREIL